MKKAAVVILCLLAASTLAGLPPYEFKVNQAHAQQPVSSHYSNPDFGFEIDFPDGWTAIDLSERFATTEEELKTHLMIHVYPGKPRPPEGGYPQEGVWMLFVKASPSDTFPFTDAANFPVGYYSTKTQCFTKSSSNISINGVSGVEIVGNPCEGWYFQKIVALHTPNFWAVMRLGMDLEDDYNKYLGDFDNTVKSFKIIGQETTTAPPTQPPSQVPPSEPNEYSQFIGDWKNSDIFTGGIVKAVVRGDSKGPIIHLFGSCQPTYCDWGEINTNYSTGEIHGRYIFGFATNDVVLSLTPDNRLKIVDFTHFTDESGRKDYTSTNYFVKETLPNQSQQSLPNVQIPSWIKNNAKWWSEGSLSDSEFLQAIQYLIQNKIINVPVAQPSAAPSQQIPSWIKNNAGWWASGQISDGEFIKTIQYLVSNGIINTTSTYESGTVKITDIKLIQTVYDVPMIAHKPTVVYVKLDSSFNTKTTVNATISFSQTNISVPIEISPGEHEYWIPQSGQYFKFDSSGNYDVSLDIDSSGKNLSKTTIPVQVINTKGFRLLFIPLGFVSGPSSPSTDAVLKYCNESITNYDSPAIFIRETFPVPFSRDDGMVIDCDNVPVISALNPKGIGGELDLVSLTKEISDEAKRRGYDIGIGVVQHGAITSSLFKLAGGDARGFASSGGAVVELPSDNFELWGKISVAHELGHVFGLCHNDFALCPNKETRVNGYEAFFGFPHPNDESLMLSNGGTWISQSDYLKLINAFEVSNTGIIPS